MLLYNSQPSGNCYKARLLLSQLGMPFERVAVDTRTKDGRGPVLGGKNPALRVPVLELDDGRHLPESGAILWYLAEDTDFVPDDRFDRARVLQWMFFEQYDHEPYIAVIRHRTMLGHLDDYADSDERRERGYKALDAMEEHLAGHAWFVGDRLHDRRHRALRVHARGGRGRLRSLRLSRDQRVARARRRGAGPHHDRRLTISVAQLRRFLVAHHGYATRARTSKAADVAGEIRRLSAVQLDSISTVDRAHRLTLTSRLGWYEPGTVSRLLGEGRIFEYWAHEACLVPIEDYPLFKRRMVHLEDAHWWGRKRQDRETEKHVLDAIRERGALPSRAFEGKSDASSMWSWKPAKGALEHLFAAGELAIAGRDGFQRVYDLPERVIPRDLLDAPTPSEEEFRRGYVLRAVEGRGAITERGIAEHCRFRGGAAAIRPIVDGLVEDGLVRRVAVADDGPPVVVAAGVEVDGRVSRGGVLVSPFDSLLWDKPFVERIFGFQPLIEVYKKEPERIYGYYVLPFLRGDRFVGRADLKADRREGVLRMKAFHVEPGVRASKRLDEALDRALARLARGIGLERVER